MDDPGRVRFKDQFGGRPGPEPEDGERAGGEDRGEGGEDVEVGGGEEASVGEGEGDAVDVAGGVEEEEAGAGEGVIGGARDLDDGDVVMEGLEAGQGLDVVDGDAIVLGRSGLGFVEVGLLGFDWEGSFGVGFEGGEREGGERVEGGLAAVGV